MTDTKGNVALGSRSPRFPSSKFSAPRAAPHLVHRSRLLDELDRGQGARLTLVVGSAGAGKTALLADWVATARQRPVAWLSCDAADSDPVRFVAAIIEALRRAAGQPDIAEDARELLSLDGEVSADVIAALADDLQRPGGAAVLVVDDFHLTEAGGAALALLLDYRPSSLQLVVASRVDPQLRLHRMRVNQELVELREADLAFSAEEASAFLSGFGLELSEADLAAVYRRSEGWVAGLQMAAISIKQSPDASSAASRVELNRRSVAGFFLDEVLYRQPPEVVDFMLATSVLDELSVPACTALCGPGSAALLQLVYSGHMFITVADDKAGTYRYHQLIKEVLQAELHGRDPARQRLLHTTAAAYLADGGQVGLATRHLLAAGDPVAAFNLLSERVVGNYYLNPIVGSALDLDEVQPDLFAGNPDILVPLATELLLRGAFDKGSRAFALAQEDDVDPDRQPELAVKLAFANALISGATGQLELVFAQRERAQQLASRVVGVDEWLFGLDVVTMQSHALAGNFIQARELHDAVASAETRASVAQVLCPGVISQVALAEGALQEAEALSQRSLARQPGAWASTVNFYPPGLCGQPRCLLSSATTSRPLSASPNKSSTASVVAAPTRLTWPNWTGPGPGRPAATSTQPYLRYPQPGLPFAATSPSCLPKPTSSKPGCVLVSETEMERSASPSGYPTIVGRLCRRSSPSPPRTLKKPQIT